MRPQLGNSFNVKLQAYILGERPAGRRFYFVSDLDYNTAAQYSSLDVPRITPWRDRGHDRSFPWSGDGN
jgi:hypothetical protein